jgi:hypothetical protein
MSDKHARGITAALALLLLAAGGCGGGGELFGLQSPTADYRDFGVADLSLERIDLDLSYDLGNPNAIDLPLATLDWDLELFQEPFSFGQIRFEEPAEGAPTEGADGSVLSYLGVQTLPANGTLALQAPFSVALADTFEGITRVLGGQDVPWALSGTLHFQTAFGNVDVPLSQSGVWTNEEVVGFLEDLVTTSIR